MARPYAPSLAVHPPRIARARSRDTRVRLALGTCEVNLIRNDASSASGSLLLDGGGHLLDKGCLLLGLDEDSGDDDKSAKSLSQA